VAGRRGDDVEPEYADASRQNALPQRSRAIDRCGLEGAVSLSSSFYLSLSLSLSLLLTMILLLRLYISVLRYFHLLSSEGTW
jgi:hypothetical protein